MWRRTSSRSRPVASAEQARRDFGVNLALDGSLVRAGDLVRINFALVNTRTRRQVRADSILASVSDPFSVQDSVVRGAVRMLEIRVPSEERQELESHGTQLASAFDSYLQGRGFLQNYDKPEQIASAIKAVDRALSQDPNYALAYAGLGEAYWRQYLVTKNAQWVESARTACQRAIHVAPRLAAAHVCAGTLANGTGAYEQAVAEFESALDAEPTSDDAYRGLAEAEEHLGRLAEAEKTYRRAIDLRPQYWAGYSWLGAFYFHQARYADAAAMFQRVVDLAPDGFRGYYNLGAMYDLEGRYSDAIAVLRQSLAVRPTAGAYTNLGNAYFYLQRFPQAVTAFEEATRLDERQYLQWANHGDAYFWAPGKRTEAAPAYRKAISLGEEQLRINPRDTDVRGTLAVCHAMLGEKRQALEQLRAALRDSPSDPHLRFEAALVYIHLGDVRRTIEWLDKALVAGFSAATVHDDPDFDVIHSDPRFQRILKGK